MEALGGVGRMYDQELSDLVLKHNEEKNSIMSTQPNAARICTFLSMAGIPFAFVPFKYDITKPMATPYHRIIVLSEDDKWMPIFTLACNMDDAAVVKVVLDFMRIHSTIRNAIDAAAPAGAPVASQT